MSDLPRVEARIRTRWQLCKEHHRTDSSVTVICDGKYHTLTPDRVREAKPASYDGGDE
jgi:hypothetical protein